MVCVRLVLSLFWFVCLAIPTLVAVSPVRAQLADPDEGSSDVDVQKRVVEAFEHTERVSVFIELRDAGAASAGAIVEGLGDRFELAYRYKSIPWMAGTLTREGLAALRQYPAVSRVQLDGAGSGGLAQALPAVGVDKVHSVRGLSGKGITVAVLDSGASTSHPALKGAIVEQHCFTQGACPPGLASESDSAEDDHNHGSNVTGIVASRGAGNISKGYAPASSIVAVKVLNRNNAGQASDWVAGFDWVADNLDRLKVKVINASLVSNAEYSNAAECDRSEGALAAVTKGLVSRGIPITVSSGNTGHTDTMTAPACNTGVFAVGATYDDNLGSQPEGGGTYRSLGGAPWPNCSDKTTDTKTIACFTCTAQDRLDLLAPGSQITSTGRGTGSSMFRGTSQAAPGVAGLIALMLECNPALTPPMLLDILKKTGEPIMDPRTGMIYPLVRGMEAVDMACPMVGVGAAGGGGSGASVAGVGGVAANAGAGGLGAVTSGSGGTSAAAGRPAVAVAGSGAAPSASAAGAGAADAGRGGTAGSVAGPSTVAPANIAGRGTLMQPTLTQPKSDKGCACSAPGAQMSTQSRMGARHVALCLAAVALVVCRQRRANTRRLARKR